MRLRGGILAAALVCGGCTVQRLPVGLSPAFLRVDSFVRLSDLTAVSPPAWSPDGEWLAFSTGEAVSLIRADRAGERRLASPPRASHVAWAPDGRQLGVLADGGLYAVSPEGTPPYLLSGDRRVRLFAWAPRGGRIAYVASERLHEEVWVIREDGSAEMRVNVPVHPARPGEEVRALSWMPDGRALWIAWGPARGMQVSRILEINTGHPGVIPPSLPLRDSAASPAFSPSGRLLAYLGGTPARLRVGVGQVMVMRTDGMSRRALTPPGAYSGLTWAPGGSLLAFALAEDESLSVIIADGVTGERLTVADYHPEMSPHAGSAAIAWAPDGLHLAVGAGAGTTASPVWVIALERL